MAFNGTEGEEITVSEGAALTAAYRKSPLNGGTDSQFFGRDILEQILNQKGCAGIRIYYGQDPKGTDQKLVIVGADGEQNDLLDFVADMSVPCPKRCGKANSLNS